LDDYTGNEGEGVNYPPQEYLYTAVTIEKLTQEFLHPMCEYILYTFIVLEISRDARDILTSPELLKS